MDNAEHDNDHPTEAETPAAAVPAPGEEAVMSSAHAELEPDHAPAAEPKPEVHAEAEAEAHAPEPAAPAAEPVAPPTAESAPAAIRKRAAGESLELAKTIGYALLIALVLRVLLFQPFTIPSASMEPTLLEGDYIIVSKYSYGFSRHSIPFSPPIFSGRLFRHDPQRGDVVVFKLPRDGHTDYIKRLIGLPGDHIQMKNGVLYINDKAVPRDPMSPETIATEFGLSQQVDRYRETLPNGRQYVTYDLRPDGDMDNTGVFVVPPHEYFMMGDNRDNSLDSRVPPENDGVGYVPEENLVGKAQIILLSWKQNASLFKPWTWLIDARPSRFFKILK